METVESRAAMPQGCAELKRPVQRPSHQSTQLIQTMPVLAVTGASWQRTALMIAARHGVSLRVTSLRAPALSMRGQHDVVVRALETSCSQPQLDAAALECKRVCTKGVQCAVLQFLTAPRSQVVDEHGNTAVMIAAREGHQKAADQSSAPVIQIYGASCYSTLTLLVSAGSGSHSCGRGGSLD